MLDIYFYGITIFNVLFKVEDMSNLIWVDLEMSGLNIDTNRILEISVVITDQKLNILAKGPDLVIYQDQAHMQSMDEWCTSQHEKTGLTADVLASNITEYDAEMAVIDFISAWVKPGVSPMCGNSIGTDREFIKKYMPDLFQWFHYRNFDVSTLKMANSWWSGSEYEKSAINQHRAMSDILESINEARYYMTNTYDS